jgi:hypothetical protein
MSDHAPQKQVTIKEKALKPVINYNNYRIKDKIRSFTKKSVIIFSKV